MPPSSVRLPPPHAGGRATVYTGRPAADGTSTNEYGEVKPVVET